MKQNVLQKRRNFHLKCILVAEFVFELDQFERLFFTVCAEKKCVKNFISV